LGRIISWLPLTTWLRPGPQKWSASRNSGIGWCVPPPLLLIVLLRSASNSSKHQSSTFSYSLEKKNNKEKFKR
jgi:hypothetical protein